MCQRLTTMPRWQGVTPLCVATQAVESIWGPQGGRNKRPSHEAEAARQTRYLPNKGINERFRPSIHSIHTRPPSSTSSALNLSFSPRHWCTISHHSIPTRLPLAHRNWTASHTPWTQMLQMMFAFSTDELYHFTQNYMSPLADCPDCHSHGRVAVGRRAVETERHPSDIDDCSCVGSGPSTR